LVANGGIEDGYRADRRLEEALLDAYEISYPEG
jgi:hypothetical protein